MTEAAVSEEPTPRRFAPILLVVATLAISSWACATALERLALDVGSSSAESTVFTPIHTPADRLDSR